MNATATIKEELAWRVAIHLQIEHRLHCKIEIHLSTSAQLGCWGMAWQHEDKDNPYCISVAEDQSLRDFVATIAHELIHVKQWLRGGYVGDGEAEAESEQYEMADAMWMEGVV